MNKNNCIFHITYLSQVLEPSPQGVFLVVIRRIFVGILIGPLTFKFSFFDPEIRSEQTKTNLKCE